MVRAWLRDVLAVVSRRRADAQLDEEMALHIDLETERHVRNGLSPDEARRRALVAFGGVDRYREQASDTRFGRALGELLRDAHHGLRILLRSPFHALATVALLALGIGASTAMFTIFRGVLHSDLPYADADRLHILYEANAVGGSRSPSYPAFRDWTGSVTAFESLAYARGDEFRLRSEDGTHRLLAAYVSDEFFATFGTRPELGRLLTSDGDDQSIVLSHHVWRTRFAAAPDVLGAQVQTSDGTYTVVGVMPRGFRTPSYADVWLSVRALPADGRFVLEQRDLHVDMEAWGRIRADVTTEQARLDLERVVGSLAAVPAEAEEWDRAVLIDARTHVVGDAGSSLRVLAAAVALVLLLTCVNVAGLQLARGSARFRELAVRAALGASRGRLIRQLLTESALLAFAGAVLGVLAARAAIDALATRMPDVLPRLEEVPFDATVPVVALLIAIATTLLTGLAPALVILRRHGAPGISASARGGTSRGTVLLRSSLVSAQVALALVLVTGSALLLRSLAALNAQQLGFEADNVAALRVFPPARYADQDAARALYERLRESVGSARGVSAAALVNHAPFVGGWMVSRFETETPAPDENRNVIIRTVSPEYFEAMGTRLLRGRLLDARDDAPGTGIVINSTAATQFFGDADPVGRTATIYHSAQGRAAFGGAIAAVVVGLVESERFFSLGETPPPAVFVPWTWMVWPSITLVARTAGEPDLNALRAAVQRIDPDIPVAGPARQAEWHGLGDHIGYSLRQQRLSAGLFTAFGTAALVLAVAGIFGTTAYLVTQRRREIAIRTAVGAQRTDVIRLILGHTTRVAAAGALIGVPAALAAGRLLRAELFGVSASNPYIIGAVTLCFLGVAILAAAPSALRAAATPPTSILRTD